MQTFKIHTYNYVTVLLQLDVMMLMKNLLHYFYITYDIVCLFFSCH